VQVDATPAGVRVSVTDHGVGIPSGARDRIFAPFGQIDSSDTRAAGAGAGLTPGPALPGSKLCPPAQKRAPRGAPSLRVSTSDQQL